MWCLYSSSDSLFDKFHYFLLRLTHAHVMFSLYSVCCISVFFYIKKKTVTFFFRRKGWSRKGFIIISFLRAPGLLLYIRQSLRNYGKTVRSFVACVTPFAQHRVTSATLLFIFLQKKNYSATLYYVRYYIYIFFFVLLVHKERDILAVFFFFRG